MDTTSSWLGKLPGITEEYNITIAKQHVYRTGLLGHNAVPCRAPEENHLTMSLLSADMSQLAQRWGLADYCTCTCLLTLSDPICY